MKSAEIRQTFIDFFVNKPNARHAFVPSAPVVPQDDPTLLFTNAGMNQFKDIFLGKGKRSYSRAANSQKCIRVSGKHNDLEEVGPSPIHHTLFEMLGNWSFGDYYKAEAIRWAWELLTEVYKLDKSKLYATVFTDDDEAHELWESETDIKPSHISRHGAKDNFWEMGEIGPCGPCTELHYDLEQPFPGRVSLPGDGPNSDSGRFIELWNLVFIQSFRDENGDLHDLPAKHVDTGAGLERIARVTQGVNSNYQTDLFQPIILTIEEFSRVKYDEVGGVYTPHRVITDHLRSLSFAIADGALPGNEGRGYVLRRILRRAARFYRELDIHEPFLYRLVPVLVDVMGDHFTELKEREGHIEHVLRAEEESFARTLDRGMVFFEEAASKAAKEAKDDNIIIAGRNAFQLYDTYGFPIDLTQMLAREIGLTVDVEGFERFLEGQRERSRKGAKALTGEGEYTTVTRGDDSKFVGFEQLKIRTQLRMYRIDEGEYRDANDPETEVKPILSVILAQTPFYAESGGQVADHGVIQGKEFHLNVIDVRQEGDLRVHLCRATRLPSSGRLPEEVAAVVDAERRRRILPHHTTTHLLQAALRTVLGDHVTQAGSRVLPDYMTFDYTHFEKPSHDQLIEAEEMVNRWIREDLPVSWEYTDIETAKSKGAMALFGEKYGEVVRAVKIGDEPPVSLELCGGTHVNRTGEIAVFRIESETAVSAGVRRITSTSGEAGFRKTQEERKTLQRIVDLLGSYGSDPAEKLEKALTEQKKMEKEIERLKKAALQGAVNFIDDWGREVNYNNRKILLISGVYEAATDRESLQAAGDKIVEDLKKANREGIGVVGAAMEETFMIVTVVTDDLIRQGIHAGKLVGGIAKKAGGGGGGKPNFATAGSRDLERAAALLKNTNEITKFVESFIST